MQPNKKRFTTEDLPIIAADLTVGPDATAFDDDILVLNNAGSLEPEWTGHWARRLWIKED